MRRAFFIPKKKHCHFNLIFNHFPMKLSGEVNKMRIIDRKYVSFEVVYANTDKCINQLYYLVSALHFDAHAYLLLQLFTLANCKKIAHFSAESQLSFLFSLSAGNGEKQKKVPLKSHSRKIFRQNGVENNQMVDRFVFFLR